MGAGVACEGRVSSLQVFVGSMYSGRPSQTDLLSEPEERSKVTETKHTTPVSLSGWWRFDEPSGTATDLSGGNHAMTPIGDPTWVGGGKFGGGYALDGATQWLCTDGPVVRTDESFSVAAWVRLDSAALGGELALRPDWYAVTAVSQDGGPQSPFYLGARLIDHPLKSGTNYTLRWNFTVAPPANDVTGVDWAHAYAQQVIDVSELDQWVLLVGVYDFEGRSAYLYAPDTKDTGRVRLPEHWPAWRAEGGLQLGRARFRDEVADQWPGSVGQSRVYSGRLSAADAASLYAEDRLAGE
jgi:hypothetical protein